MRVLGLSSYPIEAAATRFRLEQFVGPLRERGIELTVSPFLDSRQFRELYSPGGAIRKAAGMALPLMKRLGQTVTAGRYDVLLVQREAMFFGPAIFEWLFQMIGRVPLVLDLDDATYVRYESPTYGKLGSALKFFGKTDNLIRRASLVICGNRFIAEYAERLGARTVIIPTVVDTEVFKPAENKRIDDVPTIGWIGTHSTFPFLASVLPVLERLGERHRFRLKVVGAGRKDIRVRGVEVELPEWDLEREVADFQSLNIGLYPITVSESANKQWLMGKSGFKAIQYMAVGVPFVMSPVGVCAEIGETGKTHFNAASDEDWYNSLNTLLSDAVLRERMGVEGRLHSVSNYSLNLISEDLARSLTSVYS